jgi:hypothetical protein
LRPQFRVRDLQLFQGGVQLTLPSGRALLALLPKRSRALSERSEAVGKSLVVLSRGVSTIFEKEYAKSDDRT